MIGQVIAYLQTPSKTSCGRSERALIPLIKLTRKIPDSNLNSDSDRRTRQGSFLPSSNASNKWAEKRRASWIDWSIRKKLFFGLHFLAAVKMLFSCRLFEEIFTCGVSQQANKSQAPWRSFLCPIILARNLHLRRLRTSFWGWFDLIKLVRSKQLQHVQPQVKNKNISS